MSSLKTLSTTQITKLTCKIEDLVINLDSNLSDDLLGGLLSERQFEQVQLYQNLGGEKIQHCECMIVHREQGFFRSVFADDIKIVGKKRMWLHVEQL